MCEVAEKDLSFIDRLEKKITSPVREAVYFTDGIVSLIENKMEASGDEKDNLESDKAIQQKVKTHESSEKSPESSMNVKGENSVQAQNTSQHASGEEMQEYFVDRKERKMMSDERHVTRRTSSQSAEDLALGELDAVVREAEGEGLEDEEATGRDAEDGNVNSKDLAQVQDLEDDAIMKEFRKDRENGKREEDFQEEGGRDGRERNGRGGSQEKPYEITSSTSIMLCQERHLFEDDKKDESLADVSGAVATSPVSKSLANRYWRRESGQEDKDLPEVEVWPTFSPDSIILGGTVADTASPSSVSPTHASTEPASEPQSTNVTKESVFEQVLVQANQNVSEDKSLQRHASLDHAVFVKPEDSHIVTQAGHEEDLVFEEDEENVIIHFESEFDSQDVKDANEGQEDIKEEFVASDKCRTVSAEMSTELSSEKVEKSSSSISETCLRSAQASDLSTSVLTTPDSHLPVEGATGSGSLPTSQHNNTIEFNELSNQMSAMPSEAIEVERKFMISDNCIEKLSELGAELLKEKTFMDCYYDNSDYSLTISGLWLRKRNCAWELKVKAANYQSFSTTYDEITKESQIIAHLRNFFNVSPSKVVNNMEDLLNVLQLKEFAVYTTDRKTFSLKECTIDLDLTDFGFQVGEIEVMVSHPSHIPAALDIISRTAQQLGMSHLSLMA